MSLFSSAKQAGVIFILLYISLFLVNPNKTSFFNAHFRAQQFQLSISWFLILFPSVKQNMWILGTWREVRPVDLNIYFFFFFYWHNLIREKKFRALYHVMTVNVIALVAWIIYYFSGPSQVMTFYTPAVDCLFKVTTSKLPGHTWPRAMHHVTSKKRLESIRNSI